VIIDLTTAIICSGRKSSWFAWFGCPTCTME